MWGTGSSLTVSCHADLCDDYDYTADLPTSPESTTATFANDTAVLATDSDPAIASHKLKSNLTANQNGLTKMENKS
jgi:hypothetical protein